MGPHDIGRRIKLARHDRGMTLKAVEAASGVSATHISEIERGAASPTVGALARIALALGHRTGFFLEEDEIGEISIVTRENRVRETLDHGSATVERLTAGLPGGRLQVNQMTLAPGRSHRTERHAHAGAEALLVVSGRVRVVVGDDDIELEAGEAVHYAASRPHAYFNGSRDAVAVLLWIASRREAV
ncbi:MAG TPA: XRE family transcriptional regulator [Candidatus Krumholzibacteria bacterium]|nr:XRE family transcriptional regulator [Candidatus Krumholzibacteria bacterium]